MKHVYQALPRLLSLWFEFNAIGKGNSIGLSAKGSKDGESSVHIGKELRFGVPISRAYSVLVIAN